MSVRVADIPLPHPEEWRLAHDPGQILAYTSPSADAMVFEALVRLFGFGMIHPRELSRPERAFFGIDGRVRVLSLKADHDWMRIAHSDEGASPQFPHGRGHGYFQRAIAGDAVEQSLGVWETIFYFEGAE